MTTPSPAEIEAAKTPRGGFSKESFKRLGLPYPPSRGWRRELERRWRAEQRAKRKPPLDLEELSLNEWL